MTNLSVKFCEVYGLVMGLISTWVVLITFQGFLSGHGQISEEETLLNGMLSMGERAGSEHMLKKSQQSEPILLGQEIDEMGGIAKIEII